MKIINWRYCYYACYRQHGEQQQVSEEGTGALLHEEQIPELLDLILFL